jgi:hypothetical protein
MYKHSLASYTVMHVAYFLSLIVLHRAYIPFLPLRCSEPVGPLDEPTFPRDKYAFPEGFWRDSTKELFRAARLMMDLVVTCQERGVLVETPLVGFAIYNAAFMGIYAAHFGHMDQEGYLSSTSSFNDGTTGSGAQPQAQVRRSLDILRDMRQRLSMAAGWFRTLNRLNSYFVKVKKDFKINSRRSETIPAVDGVDAPSNGIRPVREGGLGGGQYEFKLLEKLFLDFGNIEDQIPEVGGALEEDGTGQVASLCDRGVAVSETGSNAVKSESGDSQVDGAGRRESWVPVNNNPTHNVGGVPDGERSRSEHDRRPSLPLPASRSLPPQSPYSLPSLQHHSHNSITSTASPSLPSLTSPGAFTSPPTNQPPPSQFLASGSNRLQPLNSWITSHQQPPPPPYSQSLPRINATAQHGFTMLPPPGSVAYPTSPALVDEVDYSMWSASLGGDDVVAFLDGGSYEQWPSISNCEVGYPTGWLSAVWNDLG